MESTLIRVSEGIMIAVASLDNQDFTVVVTLEPIGKTIEIPQIGASEFKRCANDLIEKGAMDRISSVKFTRTQALALGVRFLDISDGKW